MDSLGETKHDAKFQFNSQVLKPFDNGVIDRDSDLIDLLDWHLARDNLVDNIAVQGTFRRNGNLCPAKAGLSHSLLQSIGVSWKVKFLGDITNRSNTNNHAACGGFPFAVLGNRAGRHRQENE